MFTTNYRATSYSVAEKQHEQINLKLGKQS